MQLQLTRRPADGWEAHQLSHHVIWDVKRGMSRLAHVISGALCCLAKAEGWTLSHGPVGIHSFLHAVQLVCSTRMHEVLAVACAGKVLEGWHVFPLPLDTHKDWPNLQHGLEQLPGHSVEALDTPAFYRCAGQQTWLGLLHAAAVSLCIWSCNKPAVCTCTRHKMQRHPAQRSMQQPCTNQLPQLPAHHQQSYDDVTLTAACCQHLLDDSRSTFMGSF